MSEVILDALLDSFKIFAFVFAFNFVFSFFGKKINRSKMSVPVGAALGLLPQCGFSVIAAERYKKKKLSPGTLLAVFIATSDEAIPILLSNTDKFSSIVALLLLKLCIAIIVGYIADFLLFKNTDKTIVVENGQSESNKSEESQEHHADEESVLCGHKHHACCGSKNGDHGGFVHEHLLHPLLHSLKTFLIVLVFNLIFSVAVFLIGEENFSAFLKTNAVLAPLFSILVGLIPNCASSVIISQLFAGGNLSFGACLGGLIANAGVGLTVLFGKGANAKDVLKIVLTLIITALIAGYACCLIIGF